MERWKASSEIRKDGPDRCRIKGCKVPMHKTEPDNLENYQPWIKVGSCGNHECDKPADA